MADGKKVTATTPLNTHSTYHSVVGKSTTAQQHSTESTSTYMSAVGYTNPLKQCTSSASENTYKKMKPIIHSFTKVKNI